MKEDENGLGFLLNLGRVQGLAHCGGISGRVYIARSKGIYSNITMDQ